MKSLFFIASLFVSASLFSQRPATGTWLTMQLPVVINKNWQLPNDFNYRTLGNSPAALQQLYRAGIKYSFNSHWSTTTGIAVTYNRTAFTKQVKEFGMEFRFWQEANYKRALAKNLVGQLRLRTEERSFAATSYKTAYHAFRYRIKPQLQQKITARWSVLIADEYMQQYAKSNWSFDQNRLIINGIYALGPQAQLQAGYMWLRWPAGSSQHIITIGFQKTILLHA